MATVELNTAKGLFTAEEVSIIVAGSGPASWSGPGPKGIWTQAELVKLLRDLGHSVNLIEPPPRKGG